MLTPPPTPESEGSWPKLLAIPSQSKNMKKIMAMALALTITGCAVAPPNTPGAGSGQTYTPFVDMQGLDGARYSSDLASCRGYAQQIDPNKEAMTNMMGGIIVGALLGAALGGNGRFAEQTAIAGGSAGVAGGGGRAVNKQETVIANCMAGRGYRVLAGATMATNTSALSPYTYGNASASVAPSALVATTSQAMPMPTAQPTAAANTPAAFASLGVGPDARTVERMAMAQACAAQPVANRTATGPGYDVYDVACTTGTKLTVRCEFGTCNPAR